LSSVAPRCPSCQQPISRDKIVNDKAFQKEIQSLDVYCLNNDKGCDWEGTLKDFLVNRFFSFSYRIK
jgi:TNF receptor-associated factor 3